MKRVAITGCTGGMGQLLCKGLAEQGYSLAICSNEADKLEEQVKSLSQFGTPIYSKVLDITNDQQVADFFGEAEKCIGKMDALYHLAGLSIPAKIEEMPEEAFDLVMDVNLKGAYLAAKYFAQQAEDGGLIVNIGSMAARRVNGNAPVYCVAKGAVNLFSQGLSIQLAQKGIRVTTLNPGGTDTGFWGDRPVNRQKLLQPAQVVDLMLFVLEADPKVAIHSIDFEALEALR